MMHKHHNPPIHRVGPHNKVVRVSVTCHAMFHYCEWKLWGHKQDWLAWQGLVGCVSKEDILESLPNGMLGKTHSEETKKLISEKAKGNQKWKGRNHSQETKEKISKASKERNNRPEVKEKIRAARNKQQWWNNGKISRLSVECPGPEWSLGSMTAVYGRMRKGRRVLPLNNKNIPKSNEVNQGGD